MKLRYALLPILYLMLVPPASAVEIEVTNLDETGQGSLRASISDAGPGDVITFSPELSGGKIDLAVGSLEISQNLTITAAALSGGVTIDMGGSSRVMKISPGATVILESLTLTGGITVFDEDDPQSTFGAGIYTSGNLTLNRCTISENTTTNGGFDHPGHGGGIYQHSGDLTLIDSTISNNRVGGGPPESGVDGGFGGGIYQRSGTLTVRNSLIASNQAGDGQFGEFGDGRGGFGGGIICEGGTALLQNTTITGNQTGTGIQELGGARLRPVGGGISLLGGTLRCQHCTIVANTSHGLAGGIGGGDGISLENSIVCQNTAVLGEPNFPDSQHAILTGQNFLSGDPQLTVLEANGGPTLSLKPTELSPVIDSADPSAIGVDQRSFPRPDGIAPDIGAVEFQRPAITVTTSRDEDDGSLDPNLGSGLSLREAVNHGAAGSVIGFSPSLSGGEVQIDTGEITISKSLTIQATDLPSPVTISGNNQSRLFIIDSSQPVKMGSLVLTGGNATEVRESQGGAVDIRGGHLVIAHSTITRNTAVEGGGINGNDGSLELKNSTISYNKVISLGKGAGIASDGTDLTISNSTIANNTASSDSAGGIFHESAILILDHSTIANNQGGGILITSSDTRLIDSVIGQNPSGLDVNSQANLSLISSGTNFIGDLTGSGLSDGNYVITGDPQLSPLRDNGGKTQTMIPLPGSPLIDALEAGSQPSDQRGQTRDDQADIGSVEVQTEPVERHLIWTSDWDGDGNPYGVEVAVGTGPGLADANSLRNLATPIRDQDGRISVSFGYTPEVREYTIWILSRSADLTPGSFEEIFRYVGPSETATLAPEVSWSIAGDLSRPTIVINDALPNVTRYFYRFESILVP